MGSNISKNLQAIRAQRGLTASQVAGLAGLSEGTVLRHEHGYDMTVPQLLRYAEVLECSVDDILYGPLSVLGHPNEDNDDRMNHELAKVARRYGYAIRFATEEDDDE